MSAGTSSAEPSIVPGRRGTCRLCFDEGGGDLVAPCMCRGTSKWIHRECLNQWRANGSNPRALTNCCECGFQYRLRLKRDDTLSSEGEVRRRQLMRRLASQTLLWFVALQVTICGLGCIIRAVDSKEGLVKLYGFPQFKGHEGQGTFIEALKFHKLTYYVSSVILLLAIAGFVICLSLLVVGCSGRGSARQARRECSSVACGACAECCCPRPANACEMYLQLRMCEDCGRCCMLCCGDCSRNCGGLFGSLPGIGGHADCKDGFVGIVVVMLVIVAIVFVVVGLFAAIMAFVTAVQKATQEFAKIQQLRVMATEFEVQDLADPEDLGDAAPGSVGPQASGGPTPQQAMAPAADQALPSAPAFTEEDLRAQASIEQELAEMFGSSAPMASEQAVRGYGAA